MTNDKRQWRRKGRERNSRDLGCGRSGGGGKIGWDTQRLFLIPTDAKMAAALILLNAAEMVWSPSLA